MTVIRTVLLVGIVVSCFFTSGCGLLLNGRKQQITIETIPPGARIRIPEADVQTVAPASVALPRSKDYVLIADKAGYEPTRAYVSSDPDPLPLVLDLVIFFPSLFVDAPLGAPYKLNPETVRIALEKQTPPP